MDDTTTHAAAQVDARGAAHGERDRSRLRRRRLLLAVGAAALLAAAAAAVGIWSFLRDDAPEAVSIEGATASLPSAASGAGAANAPGSAPGDITGTWVVDTSIGTFSYEDSSGTFVGFRVEENLAGIGDATAVGRTPEVSGTITIDGTTLSATTIEADMSAITTNDGRHDGKVRDALDTEQFPTATFVLTAPVDLGDTALGGQQVEVMASGDLTIHGVTRAVAVPLQARLVDDMVVVVGSVEITFADYGVSVPEAPIVLSAQDHGVVELQLLLRRS